MATDEDAMDVIFKTIKVPAARGGAYGLHFKSSYPVMLADIDPGSPADKAGLKRGDFLILLNGNDIQRSSEEAVRTIIKYSQGSQLSIRIARPHPFPSTDYLKRRAIITLQTKLAAGVADTNDEAATYKKTVESAFLEVQDILGSLGLGDDDDILASGTSASNSKAIQEVKVQYQGDSDSLESPPGSEKDPYEVLDPLLDFGLDDDMTISHGKGGGASAGADLVKSSFEVQRALKGMKQLTDDLNVAKEQKRLARERGQVTTEATFTMNFQSSSADRMVRHPSASPPPPPAPQPSVQSSSLWSPQETSPPPPSSWSSSAAYAPPPPSSAGTTISMSANTSSVNGVKERAVREKRDVLHSQRRSNGYSEPERQGRQGVGTTTYIGGDNEDEEEEEFSYKRKTKKSDRSQPPPAPVPYRQRIKKEKRKVDESVPPPVPAYQPKEESAPPVKSSYSHFRPDEEDVSMPPVPPYNPAGPEDFMLSNKPEYRKEWKMKTNTYEALGERESGSPPPMNTYEEVRERVTNPPAPPQSYKSSARERKAAQQHQQVTPQPYEIVRERSLSPPPPIPIRQHPNLSKTVSEPPPPKSSPSRSSAPSSSSSSSNNKDKYKDISLANVPLRSKKRGGNQGAAPAQEPAPVGHVELRQGGGSSSSSSGGGRKMKYDVNTSPSSVPTPVKDVSDVRTACAGLPNNVSQWKKDDVGVWLKQLSPTLYDHYSALFAKHDVTGRTLLRLNATKLQSLGVTTPAHCRILATEIMRVRIHQEANELRSFRR